MRAAAPRARLLFLGALAFLWLSVLVVRLVELQVVRHAELAGRATRQQQRTLEVTPKRGILYDRNGRELAVSIGVDSLFAIPEAVADPTLAARLLAPVLALEPRALEQALRSQRSFVWVKRKLAAEEAARARALGLAGLHFQREYKRFYPKRELAAHVLGFVGIDEDGLAGIEYALDSVIRGRSRRLVITADGRRRWFERRTDAPPEGAGVVLTLDETIQYIAEQELAAAMARTRARSGTVIVQNPRSGEILALANYPTYNPNNPTAVPLFRHLNRALSLAYEPGSTFKVVTIAAALEAGLADPREIIDCQQGSIVLAGHRIRDHKPFGRLSLREVVYESSDVGAIKVALRVGRSNLYRDIRRWKFGQRTGIELPAESPGILRPVEKWSAVSLGALAMGQELAVTPLQLTAALSAIANQGVWVRPRIVREIVADTSGARLPPPHRERIITRGVAEELRRMLVGVVTRGTGEQARPAGYTAAGKTGTAEKIDETGTYSATDFIASFAGFAPAHDPAVTVLVVLDTPRGEHYHGGEVAAPVFRTVVERVLAYLNVPHDQPLLWPQAPPLERAALGNAAAGKNDAAGRTISIGFGETDSPPAKFAFDLRRPQGRTIVLNNQDTVTVPDLTGLSLRALGERCARLGLEPVLAGNGLVARQHPAAGTRVPRGSRVWVEFTPELPAVPTRPM